ncbi:MAG: ABC transporter substrate binding protein, partial [Pseudolabrys sp.]
IQCHLLNLESDMQRQKFITLLGGAAWPFGARAATWKIADNRILRGSHACGRDSLARRIRQAQGRCHRHMGLCTGPRGQAGATQVIPVVFAAQMDPVGAGVVVSLARPGGNLTGLSLQQTDTAGKRLELLREVVPGLRRLAIIANVDAAGAVIETREIAATARALNLDVILLEIQCVKDIAPAIERSRPAQTHFMWRPIPSCSPIGSEPMPWREVRDCRQSTAVVSMSKREL